ncbi:hypothetical protein D3C72_2292090 [compost metagenome]
METAEARPADLNRAEAGKDEAGRRDQGAERRLSRVFSVRPQRIVVANALAEAQDRQPRRVLVIEAGFGTQLGSDQSPHVVEHLVGELALGKLLGNVG